MLEYLYMELRYLKYFIAVAEELHFANAANRLHLAQPSLSKQIRLLEEELGFPLLYRTKQKVELLDAGHVFLDEARRILRQTENAVESARRTQAGQSGRLLIGYSSSATLEVLPKILRKFCRLYPNVTVELSEMSTIRAAELLLDSPLSVGLLRSPSFFNEESFCIETILREPFVVALPSSHPASKQKSVRIKTLADEPFIVPHRQPGWDYSDAFFEILRDNGIEPRIAQEASQSIGVAILVAGGLGVGFVPASITNLRLPGLIYRPIEGRSRTTALSLVWKRTSRASTVRAFLDVVRAEYPKR
ncbi:MAG TPA: LysR substrate-binding domain-containing protein [Chthoniobacterales bacterium]|nr:LysR substrate-binding domain-containing protein [Chthoniobacterales bacterium]